MLDWSLRRKGGGEIGALPSSFLLGGFEGLAIVTRYLRRVVRFKKISRACQYFAEDVLISEGES